jgi:hypothetical protein
MTARAVPFDCASRVLVNQRQARRNVCTYDLGAECSRGISGWKALADVGGIARNSLRAASVLLSFASEQWGLRKVGSYLSRRSRSITAGSRLFYDPVWLLT